jgi:hypothetical protein
MLRSLPPFGLGLGVIAVAAIATVFLFTTAIPQDPGYHQFADTRQILGIENFANVLSNLVFLIVGVAGLLYVFRYASQICIFGLEVAYGVFFVGIFLTSFGSSYYHLAPGNETLVWDRLPMTIGFAALVTIVVGEYVSEQIAARLLVPLLLIGFASVEYWAWTEARGVGDLRPYALVQFLPMLMIPVILLRRQPFIGKARYFWWMIASYFAAKLFEFFDAEVYALGHIISGHSIKHIAAALTPAIFLYALTQRR